MFKSVHSGWSICDLPPSLSSLWSFSDKLHVQKFEMNLLLPPLRCLSNYAHLDLTIIPQEMNNQPTPWSRVLLEKVIITQLVKKFPAIYGTWRFITMFIRSHHCSLSWTKWLQPTTSHLISLQSILMFLSVPRSSSHLVFQPKFCMHFSS